jgi:hypothetical protein
MTWGIESEPILLVQTAAYRGDVRSRYLNHPAGSEQAKSCLQRDEWRVQMFKAVVHGDRVESSIALELRDLAFRYWNVRGLGCSDRRLIQIQAHRVPSEQSKMSDIRAGSSPDVEKRCASVRSR